MQKERAAEEEINRHLRLEIDTLRSPARIERLATQRLGMVTPKADDATVIERVTSTPPPPEIGRRQTLNREKDRDPDARRRRSRQACQRLAHNAQKPHRRGRRRAVLSGRPASKLG
jgi:hypothetical protein